MQKPLLGKREEGKKKKKKKTERKKKAECIEKQLRKIPHSLQIYTYIVTDNMLSFIPRRYPI